MNTEEIKSLVNEMFCDVTQSRGDLAGVFEFDGETGYFYLYKIDKIDGNRVIDSLHIFTSEHPPFGQTDIAIQWGVDENKVGLVINKILWAVFESQNGTKFGGGYQPNTQPGIPKEMVMSFALH